MAGRQTEIKNNRSGRGRSKNREINWQKIMKLSRGEKVEEEGGVEENWEKKKKEFNIERQRMSKNIAENKGEENLGNENRVDNRKRKSDDYGRVEGGETIEVEKRRMDKRKR